MFNILSIGKSHWRKGYSYALDALRVLKEQNVKFTYTIIGGINLELKYQIIELGLENDVLIIDHLLFNELQHLLKSSDLVLLTCVKEENDKVMLQAMAAQKLVLATNCKGFKNMIIDGVNGFIIPIRNVEAMSKKMIEINQISKEQKYSITTKALETIKQHYTEEIVVSSMEDLYKSI